MVELRGDISVLTLLKRPIQLVVGVIMPLIVGVLLCASPVFADRLAPQPNISLKQMGSADLTAYGGTAKLDIWFPGYGDYELKDGSYLNLEYDHSELVHPDDSSVTVLLNDVPLSTTLLNEKNLKRTEWRISIPQDKLKRDLNHVELRYYMHLRDNNCQNNESLALYSTVYADSYIHYEYATPLRFIDLPPPDLGRFPEPFIRPTIAAGEVAIVIPDNPSSSDFSAAASVAARFGQLASGKPFTATLYFAGDVDRSLLTKQDLVMIGRPDANVLLQEIAKSLPLKYKQDNGAAGPSIDTKGEIDGRAGFVDGSGAPIDPESGVLQEIISPWDKRFAVLVVSGGTDEAVRRAARTLSSRLGTKSLQGAYAIVNQATEDLIKGVAPVNDNSVVDITLQQLGLNDSQVRGVGSHTIQFNFDAPPAQQAAYFDLVLSYSPLLDQERSSVTVTLNGIPIRSVLLKGGNGEQHSERISLPVIGLRPGINSIALQFNLYPQYADECGPLAGERAWAVLLSASKLELPVSPERPPLDLANLPYPFVRNGTLSGMYLVLPDDRSLLKDSLQVAVALGRQSLGGSTELRAGLAADFDDEAKRSYDIVAYGLPENNTVIAGIKPDLPLALEGNRQRSLQQHDLVLLGVKDAANLGIIELVRSPWNARKDLLVLSGTSSENVELSQQALSTSLSTGNVAVVSGDARPVSIKIAGDKERGPATELTQRKIYTFAAVPVVAVIVGLLGIMLTRVGSSGRSE